MHSRIFTKLCLIPRSRKDFNINSWYRNNALCFSTKTENLYAIKYNYRSVSDMQIKSSELYKDKPLFGTKNGDHFDWITFGEFGTQVQLFRNVLSHHKVGKNDKVAIISNNRVEWAVAMYAVSSLGAQLVPM